MKIAFYASLLSLICLWGCQNNTQQAEENKGQGEVAPPPPPTPSNSVSNTTHFRANVEDLRIRESADLNAKVIEKVAIGTLLKDLKQQSDTEVEVELQGEKKKAPFYRVKTASGKEGWVHGAGVYAVSLVPRLLIPSDANKELVDKYAAFLSKLNANEPESFQKALAEYDKAFQSANPSTCELGYVKLRDFGEKITEKSFNWKTWEKYVDAEKNKGLWKEQPAEINMAYDDYFKKLAACGLWVDQTEGAYFVVPDPGAMAKHVSMKCTPTMRDYLAQIAKETKNRNSEDNGLVITPKELATRMFFWENFSQKNSSFILKNEAENNFRDDLHTLVMGMNNTPAFDYENKELNPDFKDAYEWIVREHGSSIGGSTIRGYYDLVKANKMKLTPAVEQKQKMISEREFPYMEWE